MVIYDRTFISLMVVGLRVIHRRHERLKKHEEQEQSCDALRVGRLGTSDRIDPRFCHRYIADHFWRGIVLHELLDVDTLRRLSEDAEK